MMDSDVSSDADLDKNKTKKNAIFLFNDGFGRFRGRESIVMDLDENHTNKSRSVLELLLLFSQFDSKSFYNSKSFTQTASSK